MANPSSTDRLIVALDVPSARDARAVVVMLGDTVSFYKIGHELLFSGGLDLARELKSEGKRVFIDMKLLDIGNTMERSVANAANLGVDFLTIHGHDSKSIKAAVRGRSGSTLKLLAVTVLTNLTADDTAEQGHTMSPSDLVLHRARLTHLAGCDGVIASGQEASAIRGATSADFLIVTPGIRLAGEAHGDQSRITTPDGAILAGANHIVVGRPILEAADPRATAHHIVTLLTP